MSKKKNKASAPSERRKVRAGAIHMNQEGLARQRAVAFSRRIRLATTHRIVGFGNRTAKPIEIERNPKYVKDISEVNVTYPGEIK